MAESEVFWLGGRPGQTERKPQLADDDAFVAEIRTACEAMGFEVDGFVSAEGPYGTWLVELRRDGNRQRVLWNGKDEIMVLQVERPAGGWDDARELAVPERDTPGFATGVRAILAAGTA